MDEDMQAAGEVQGGEAQTVGQAAESSEAMDALGAALSLLSMGSGPDPAGRVQHQSPASTGTMPTAAQRRTLKPQATRTPPEERVPQSGSASSSLEAMFSALRHELRQDMHEFQGRTDAKLDQVQRVVRSAIEPLEAKQEEMENKLTEHADAIEMMRRQIAELRSNQKGTAAEVTEVKKEMAMAADAVPPPRPQPSGWDREADPTILVANSKATFAEDELIGALAGLLRQCNVPSDQVRFVAPRGQTAAQRWTVRFLGEPRLAARRAAQVIGGLRGDDGEWIPLEVASATGLERCRLYVGVDKSPKQTRTEVMGKRLASMARELRPDLQWRLLRDEGVVCVGYQRILKVVADPTATTLQFAAEGVVQYGIDKAAFTKRWETVSATAGSATWGS